MKVINFDKIIGRGNNYITNNVFCLSSSNKLFNNRKNKQW